MTRLKLKHIGLLLLAVIITVVFVPVVFLLELSLVPYFPTTLQADIQISVADAFTAASILGAVSVFVLERLQTSLRTTRDRQNSEALRLILKHIREQDEPATIEELWQIFKNDKEGRKLYCEGAFDDISLDDFTAFTYALQFESQIEITHGGQAVLRTPFHVKVKRASEADKSRVMTTLIELADQATTGYIRTSAIEGLAKIKDAAVVPVVQKYLDDSDPEVRLAAVRALIELMAFPEQ